MRTIHSDLIAAQQSGSADPYIYLEINSTDYSSRIVAIYDPQEPYRHYAIIVLANSDRHFYNVNLRGKPFDIGYGYVTESGNRYCGDGRGSEAMPTMWVKSQSLVSMEGKLVCILYCESGWAKLREFTFVTTAGSTSHEANYFNIKFTATDTIYELIEKAIEEAGFTLTYESIDDIIQAFHPIFTANPLEYESPAYLIVQGLLPMTACYMREIQSEAFEIIYPREYDAVKETYYSYKAPYFKEYTEERKLLVPNHVVVFCNRDQDGQWDTEEYPLIVGEAYDPLQFTGTTYNGNYVEVIEYKIAPYIGTQTDANNRAEAVLSRHTSEEMAGRLVLPFHDCRVELYDKPAIHDRRGL